MKAHNKEISEEKANETVKEKRAFDEEEYRKKLEKKKKLKIIIPIVSISVLIIVAFFCTGFALFNKNNNKIISKISIEDMQVSGLTQKEVEEKLDNKIKERLEKDVILKSGDFEYTLNLNQIEAKYNVQKAVEEAFETGRNGNIIENNFEIIRTMTKGKNIKLEFEYNDKILTGLIEEISLSIPDAVEEPSYSIEGDKLHIVKGKEGKTINKESLKTAIEEILNNFNKEMKIDLDIINKKPEEIDIEKIYNEVYKEPKDAYYTKDPFTIYPHEDGIKFNLDDAKEILKDDKEEYEIKLEITQPKVKTGDLGTEAFPDLLSTYSTKYDAGLASRTNNMVLAMRSLDGVVVNPGEVFSYNKTLGQRTKAKGYQEAGGYAGGRVVQLVGGGICQVSSTLYNAALYANLEIVERYNHMFNTIYAGAGRDATVSYGTLDFKFKNTRKYPIMIKTSIGSGICKISIFGIKEDVEYEIEISTKILGYTPYSTIYENDYSLAEGTEKVEQSGMNGCRSVTYKIVKLNGQEISNTVLSNDSYDPMNRIIKRGAKKTAQVNNTPVQQPVVEQPVQTQPSPEPEPNTQPEPQPTEPETPQTVPDEEPPEVPNPPENTEGD